MYNVGDIVRYKYYAGKGERLFRVEHEREDYVECIALNGYIGLKKRFEKVEKPFEDVGLTQLVASGLEVLSPV